MPPRREATNLPIVMKLPIPEYPSSLFDWHGNVGCAFYTDVCGRSSIYNRLYDDAEDRGFAVVSKRTGKKITFVLEKITEGDPCEFIFKSIDGFAKYGKYKIKILNT